MIEKIKQIIRHNPGIVTGIMLCVLGVIVFGCLEVTTKSVVDPTTKVTREQLDVEIENLANKITLAYNDLEKKAEIRSKLVNIGVSVVTGTDYDPIGIVVSLVGLLGLGAVVDNRIKDRVIKTKDSTLNKLTTKLKGTK